jgi:Fur family transcriptional regulator, zinc uptake regulator
MTARPTDPAPLAFRPHDHAGCVDGAMAVAEARCAERGLRLTPLRRRVLEILLESHRAMGAYDVLARLGEEGLGSQPPVAYRALDFLVELGLAHKIQRLSAFVACARPADRHSPAFLICRQCRAVAEAEPEGIRGAISGAARAAGFSVERVAVEAEGLCPACLESEAA